MAIERLRVSNPPKDKPVALFDGDCAFCRAWVDRWSRQWPGRLEFLPGQAARERFPEIPGERLQEAMHLVEGDGIVSSGAEAVLRARALGRQRRGALLYCYYNVPGARALLEAGYALVARNRPLLSRLLRSRPGSAPASAASHETVASPAAAPAVAPPAPAPAAAADGLGFATGTDAFLRVLAVVYFVAFASFWWQLPGLVGPNGLLPAQAYLDAVAQQLGGDRWWMLPTLCWIFGGGWFLHLLCLGGVACAILAFLRRLQPACFALLWLFYLSLCPPGQVFLGYQWDALLLEAGLLAVLLAPWSWPGAPQREPPPLARWLLWWLLFRLMFMSGLVKLTSGDATWRDLTALLHHYETQPLPTWIGWWAHQLPAWFQRFSCAVMFAIELVAPFLLLGPRWLRHPAALSLIGLQVLIALTGNYTFFNLLTAALCLPLLDDGWWARWAGVAPPLRAGRAPDPSRRQRALLGAAAAWLVAASIVVTLPQLWLRRSWPDWFVRAHRVAVVTRTVSSYGLFRVMTTNRPELVFEGSHDGRDWQPYEFRWKPGDLHRRPRFVAPHQPRLDWQLWFAALEFQRNRRPQAWLDRLGQHLLAGNPAVVRLLDGKAFRDKPPSYLRVVLYEYEFTTPARRSQTGEWWRRTAIDYYRPATAFRRP